MARLRVYRANGGNVYELMSQRKEKAKKEERIFEIDKRILKRKIGVSHVNKVVQHY